MDAMLLPENRRLMDSLNFCHNFKTFVRLPSAFALFSTSAAYSKVSMQYFRQFVKYSQIFVFLSLNFEEGQCTCNVILRRFRVINVAAEKQ
jgi:hypothetical protein